MASDGTNICPSQLARRCVQDYCIECPATGTLFSLKDGSIVSWYPTNPVLRMLTPQSTCRRGSPAGQGGVWLVCGC